jgi:hypothetical protein
MGRETWLFRRDGLNLDDRITAGHWLPARHLVDLTGDADPTGKVRLFWFLSGLGLAGIIDRRVCGIALLPAINTCTENSKQEA